jgi:hypothetical protein
MNYGISRACTAVALALGAVTHASAVPFFAATSSGTLSKFDTASVSSPGMSVAITGLGSGESLIGIDIRPRDQKLYIVTRDASDAGRLYTVDTTTGTATLVAALTPNPIDAIPYTSLVGAHFGMAFNAIADRIRLVTDGGQNYRVNPVTGVVLHDTDLTPGAPHVVAVAYTNAFVGATSTTLYDIDSASDSLNFQNPPNSGVLNQVGSLGVDMLDPVGFDITTIGSINYAYATAQVAGNSNFYGIDLTTGAATLIGALDGNFAAIGIAIVPDHLFANGFE